MSNEQPIVVGLGEVKVSRNPGEVLTCLGLGSCIGLAAYDPVSKVAGMAHIVLPASSNGSVGSGNPKFADIAVPLLVEELKKSGAVPARLVVKMAGGAHMATLNPNASNVMKIGERNAEATRELIGTAGLRLSGADTGGSSGRTVRLFVGTGKMTVATAGQPPRDL
jgi:chemotaxis protein CheD